MTVVASTKEYRELKAAFVVEMSVMDDDNDYLADYDKLKNLKQSGISLNLRTGLTGHATLFNQ